MPTEARRGYPSYRSEPGPDRVEPREARSRGFRISYDDVGQGAAIVLVHGFTLSGGDWWETGYVERLVGLGRRVLVVDPLGHGQSDRPHDPADYRWPDVALDIMSAMDAAGVERATLWGYSRGAAIVATAAADVPTRIEALILGGAGDLTRRPDPTVPPWLAAFLGGDWNAFWSTPFGSAYTDADRRYAERVNDPRAFAAARAGRRLFDYEHDLSRVSARALVYAGGDDEPEASERTAGALRAEHHVLPGLDHASAVSATDQVFAKVEPFLTAQRGE